MEKPPGVFSQVFKKPLRQVHQVDDFAKKEFGEDYAPRQKALGRDLMLLGSLRLSH